MLEKLTRRLRSAANVLRGVATVDFDGASTGGRLKTWLPANNGINSLVFANGEMLRARSRDLSRKNAWAARALDIWVAEVIGTGIKMNSRHPVPSRKDEYQRAWTRWTDSSDADALTDFYGQQRMIARAVMQDGECFVRMRRRRASDGLEVPLQLQVLEADFVPLNHNMDVPGGVIRGGIEFDLVGRRVAYHMYAEHPGEFFGMRSGLLRRIPASEVLHIFQPVRPGQFRGLPWFTPVLVDFHDLESCEDAVLMRMQLANMLAAYVIRPDAEGVEPLIGTDNGDGTADVTMEPGMLNYMRQGEDIKFSDPPDPGPNYDVFVAQRLRRIAMGLGLTYEKLTGDLSNVNFSSMRGGELGFRRMAEAFQHQTIAFQLCRGMLTPWLEQAALAGAINGGAYLARPQDYLDVSWDPQAWPWIDPEKDIAAKVLEIRAGFSSRQRVVSALGEDSEQVDREQVADNRRADGEGLRYESDGRQSRSASAPAMEPGRVPPEKKTTTKEAIQ